MDPLVIRSNKCAPGAFAESTPYGREGCGACDVPKAPFAQPNAPSVMTYTPMTPTVRGDIDARNSSLGCFYQNILIRNLPGDLSLHFRYRPVVTLCAPLPGGRIGWFGRFGNWVNGAQRPIGLGRCPGFVPEVDWQYLPPEDGVPCEDLQAYCRTNYLEAGDRGRDPKGKAFCTLGADMPAPQAVIDGLCGQPTYDVKDVDVTLYTRIHPAFKESRTAFTADDPAAAIPTLTRSIGSKDRSQQPSLAFSDLGIYINPVPQEVSVLMLANPKGPNDREYDNYHQKQVKFGKLARPAAADRRDRVAFLGCNSLYDLTDDAPCMHMHERWRSGLFDFGPPYNQLQEVHYIAARYNKNERTPNVAPDQLVGPPLGPNGEQTWPLGQAPPRDPAKESLSAGVGVRQLLWLKSRGRAGPIRPNPGETAPCWIIDPQRVLIQPPCRANRTPIWFTP